MEVVNFLNENFIGDLLLCDPITSRGIKALNNLGIDTHLITPDYFIDKIRVASKYDTDDSVFYFEEDYEQEGLVYRYTSSQLQRQAIKDQLQYFDGQFKNDARDGFPLLIFGVAGNGKSIEAIRRIRKLSDENVDFSTHSVYIDLETAFSEFKFGARYRCENPDSALDLFSIKLFHTIMTLLRNNKNSCPGIYNNYNNIIVARNIFDEEEKELFEIINQYYQDFPNAETKLLKHIQKSISQDKIELKIQKLLEWLMMIMYCSNPNKKNFIVFDNIEQYIALNSNQTQIYNSDISTIFTTIREVTANLSQRFSIIENNLLWKIFKIIVVSRRTSLVFLDPIYLHNPVRTYENSADFTGHFQVSAIWKNKKKYILEPFLRNNLSDDEEKVITLLDIIMEDSPKTVGTSYQSIIAPLMSYGIRRNARAQAHAVSELYRILTGASCKSIDYETFIRLIESAHGTNHAVRYMFRRSLIEIQFKWSITFDKDRWKQLNIGHFSGIKKTSYEGKHYEVEKVSFNDNNHITIFRRVLAYLSSFPEEGTFRNPKEKSVIDLFSTVSLRNLAIGVLSNTNHTNKISDSDFLQLAKVLIALGNMSFTETRSAPYIILVVKDERYCRNTLPSQLPQTLASIIKELVDSNYDENDLNHECDCADYGVRITDAGYVFMLDWLSSFSFIATLYCNTVLPLFFLKEKRDIKFVIKTVYEASVELCAKYENEAHSFAGLNTLKVNNYLPLIDDKRVTFKERVKVLHSRHLSLYRDYLRNNYTLLGLSNSEMRELTKDNGFIYNYISRYNNWETETSECF